jgi:uncharacterized membrane protein (DUF485 family)
MLHEPAAPAGKDPAYSYKRRLGVWLFLGYGIVYAGFVALNLIKPALMARIVTAGLDLAVVYGFGLIGFAILLALVYNGLCTRKETQLEERGGNRH